MELLRDRNATISATFVTARRSLEVNISDRLPFKINEGLEIIASDNIDGLPRIGWLLESFDLIKMRSKEFAQAPMTGKIDHDRDKICLIFLDAILDAGPMYDQTESRIRLRSWSRSRRRF